LDWAHIWGARVPTVPKVHRANAKRSNSVPVT
jgi:hypothetical protein